MEQYFVLLYVATIYLGGGGGELGLFGGEVELFGGIELKGGWGYPVLPLRSL